MTKNLLALRVFLVSVFQYKHYLYFFYTRQLMIMGGTLETCTIAENSCIAKTQLFTQSNCVLIFRSAHHLYRIVNNLSFRATMRVVDSAKPANITFVFALTDVRHITSLSHLPFTFNRNLTNTNKLSIMIVGDRLEFI